MSRTNSLDFKPFGCACCRFYAKQHKLEEEREKELAKMYRDRVSLVEGDGFMGTGLRDMTELGLCIVNRPAID